MSHDAQAEDDRRCWSALSKAAAVQAAAAAQPPAASLPPRVAAALRLGQPDARLAQLPQLARRLAGVLEGAGAGPPAFHPAALPGAPCAASCWRACRIHVCVIAWVSWKLAAAAGTAPANSAGGCWQWAAGFLIFSCVLMRLAIRARSMLAFLYHCVGSWPLSAGLPCQSRAGTGVPSLYIAAWCAMWCGKADGSACMPEAPEQLPGPLVARLPQQALLGGCAEGRPSSANSFLNGPCCLAGLQDLHIVRLCTGSERAAVQMHCR